MKKILAKILAAVKKIRWGYGALLVAYGAAEYFSLFKPRFIFGVGYCLAAVVVLHIMRKPKAVVATATAAKVSVPLAQ